MFVCSQPTERWTDRLKCPRPKVIKYYFTKVDLCAISIRWMERWWTGRRIAKQFLGKACTVTKVWHCQDAPNRNTGSIRSPYKWSEHQGSGLMFHLGILAVCVVCRIEILGLLRQTSLSSLRSWKLPNRLSGTCEPLKWNFDMEIPNWRNNSWSRVAKMDFWTVRNRFGHHIK